VIRLLGLQEPPCYRRAPAGSKLDAYKDAIAAMLDADPQVPATVILEHLRRDGYAGGITILKEQVAAVRPAFVAARSYQRTSYLPGELAHGDWWEPGIRIPVGNGATRKAYGWVTTLPHSAAHAVVYSLSKTMADVLHGVLGCLQRLGGVPEAMVVDNDTSIVADGVGKRAVVHPEVAALCGQLGLRLVVLEPASPSPRARSSGPTGIWRPRSCRCGPSQVLATCSPSRMPGPSRWPGVATIAGSAVGSSTPWPPSAGSCMPCPIRCPTSMCGPRSGSNATGSCGWAMSTTRSPQDWPAAGVQIRLSPAQVVVHLEGAEIARHQRSYAPADVVLDPGHARALRLARAARARLAAGDVTLEAVDLGRYDRLASGVA
jgi:hypothetical protein